MSDLCANCGEYGVCVPDPIGPRPDPICEACIASMNAAGLRAWDEYDSAAKWCAQHGSAGRIGDALPEGLSTLAYDLINDDPDAFEQHVKDTAYALAMEGVQPDE